ncbi:MAG TPA: hypothetical protein VK028_00425 [Micromonosporaceae bacterium]|nr:hypothetical protein [Micromonosporaceae bacterium]
MRHIEVRRGLYRDSVQLMQISAALADRPDVEKALVAMATGVNLDMLAEMGFEPPTDAGPNDMVVALVATDEGGVAAALSQLDEELAGETAASRAADRTGVDGTGGWSAPRSVGTGVKLAGPGAVVLVSTPGRNAFVEAMDALDAGASVMVFSDNVPVEQEVRLKRAAAARGLLVMGPDCGTAVLGGVGLGFANVVRRGPIGLVAASGTGAQHVMSLLSDHIGISHCIGVGGRDLAEEVSGASTHAALDLLDADPMTEFIVVLGKPASEAVAASLRDHIARLATPALLAPLGMGRPDLTAVAEEVLTRRGVPVPTWARWEPARRSAGPSAGEPRSEPTGGGFLRGLFSGGTLCSEAMIIAAESLGAIRSNVPLRPEWSLRADPDASQHGHWMLDLGDDTYTIGRPHPMIDFGPRLTLLERESADPSCRVLLLDVVLGHGAHPDPASELAPAIRKALERSTPLTVVVSLVGTSGDPQGLGRQAEALRQAGAWVFESNAAAARHAVSIVAGGAP